MNTLFFSRIGLFLYAFLLIIKANGQAGDALADSLKRELSKAKADSNQVKLLMDLGNQVGYYDAAAAMKYAQQGLTLSKKINYRLGQARTHYLMGNTYLDLGNYRQSKIHLDEAEQLFSALKRPDMLGKIQNARGNWSYMQSDLQSASYHYTRAVETFHALKDTALEIFPYQNLIAALGETKNHEKAIAMSKRLLKLVQKRGDSLQMAYSYNYLINNYLALNQMDSAQKYVTDLLRFIQSSMDLGLAADSYNVIGLYHFKRQAYHQAIANYQLALDKALRGQYQTAQYYHALGRTYLRLNALDSAYLYLRKAETQALVANTKDVYYRICHDLGSYFAKKEDYSQAYRYLQEYTKLNDSILVAETRHYTAYLEAAFENSKKETEILQLKTAELQKDLAIKKRNNYLIVTLGLLALGGIFFGLKVRNDQTRRKLLEQDKKLQAEKILSLEKEQQVSSLQSMITGQESERNRIAKDLHDGLGGLFSTVKMYFSTLQHEQPILGENPLFQKSMELTHTASVELRRIAHNLMPEVLMKLGLINAIQDLCNNINTSRLLNISLQAYGMEKRLNPNTEIMLYRIVQELLNNIIKHAQATEAIIQFNQHQERLNITIEDNGQGFNANEDNTGAGLSTIKSRVNYLNGALNIDSTQGVGTTVMMEFVLES